jgi:bZIP transcription factor
VLEYSGYDDDSKGASSSSSYYEKWSCHHQKFYETPSKTKMDQRLQLKVGGKQGVEGNRDARSYEEEGDQGGPGDESSDDDTQQGEGHEEELTKREGDYSNLERLRKRKRLALNRASARNRRIHKKEKLEKLETESDVLHNTNQGLCQTIQKLTARVAELESELGVARSTITRLTGHSAQILPLGSALSPSLSSGLSSAAAPTSQLLISDGVLSGVASASTGPPGVTFSALAPRRLGYAEVSHETQSSRPAAVAAAATGSSAAGSPGFPTIDNLLSLFARRNQSVSETDVLARLPQRIGAGQSFPQALELIQRASIGLPPEPVRNQPLVGERLSRSARLTSRQGASLPGGGIPGQVLMVGAMRYIRVVLASDRSVGFRSTVRSQSAPFCNSLFPFQSNSQNNPEAEILLRIVGQVGGRDRHLDDLRRLANMVSVTGTVPESTPAHLARAAECPNLMAMVRGVDGASSTPVLNTRGRPAAATSNMAAMLSISEVAPGVVARGSSPGRALLSGRRNSINQSVGAANATSNLVAFLKGADGFTDASGTAFPRRGSYRDP